MKEEPKVHTSPGISGEWSWVEKVEQPPRELKFDPKAVHESLKQDQKQRTVRIIRKHELP